MHKQVFETYFCIFSLSLIARWPYRYDTSVHMVNTPYFALSDNNVCNGLIIFIHLIRCILLDSEAFFEDTLSFKINVNASLVSRAFVN